MTSLNAIPFPNINPVFLELGPLQFRWYGLMYLIGLGGAYFLILRRVESKGLSMTKDQVKSAPDFDDMDGRYTDDDYDGTFGTYYGGLP